MSKNDELYTLLQRLLIAIEYLRNELNVNYVVEAGDIPIFTELAQLLNELCPYVEFTEWFIKHDAEMTVNPRVVTDKEYAYNLGVECGKLLAKIKEQNNDV